MSDGGWMGEQEAQGLELRAPRPRPKSKTGNIQFYLWSSGLSRSPHSTFPSSFCPERKYAGGGRKDPNYS